MDGKGSCQRGGRVHAQIPEDALIFGCIFDGYKCGYQEHCSVWDQLSCACNRAQDQDRLAVFLEEMAARYEHAERITLVMDNLNTHTPGSLYEAFLPSKAKELWERFEFI
jgi:hypothetical protein